MRKIILVFLSTAMCLFALLAASCSVKETEIVNKDAAAPIFIRHPESVTVRKGAETLGLEVSAYADDNGTLTYQWYSNDKDDNSGGTAVSGATKSYLTVSTLKTGMTYYYCVVTNTNVFVNGTQKKSAVSMAAAVKVYFETESPRIESQPESVDYILGAQTSALPLSVTATVGEGELSYMWYVSESGTYEDALAIEGASMPEYVPDIQKRSLKFYFCEVTNVDKTEGEDNSITVRSRMARISVEYDYEGFKFEKIDDTSCKLVQYTGSSINPVIPDTDSDGRAVKEIGRGVFANKSSIVSVKIPDTVEVIGIRSDSSADTDGVFFNCSALKTIVYNGKLKLVGDQTFNGCSALNVSELWNCMDMIETIGRGSFQKVILPENLVFPASLVTLEKWSFQHSKGVKTITFAGNKVKNIGGATFASISSLQSVVIPSSVISVADCLKVCPALKTVTFERSKVVHGSITAGNPFAGTYPSDFVINVPEDSYDDYRVSLGAFASYVAKPPAQTFTVTIEGATINGERTLSLESGEKLPADATVVYDDQAAFLGWAKNTAYYGDYSALYTEFEMGYEDVTLRALYPKDFTKHFIPSCRLGGKDGKPVNQQQHGTIGSLPTTRVTGTAGHSKHIVFPNGYNMLHSSDQKYCLCPVSSKYKTCLLLTFVNHTDAEITFKYMAEFDKKYVGEVIVTVPANSQKSALLVVNKTPRDNPAAYHELMITSGADNGYDLTIYGKYL